MSVGNVSRSSIYDATVPHERQVFGVLLYRNENYVLSVAVRT